LHLVAPEAYSDLALASTIAKAVPSTEVRVEAMGTPLPRGLLRSRYMNDIQAWTPLERAVSLTVAQDEPIGAAS
jgi:hypothetical protein